MKRSTHDIIGVILIAALFLIEIPRYTETLPDRDNQLVAVGMGVLLAGGAFYCVETWGMLRRRSKRKQPKRTSYLGLMVTLQVVAVPFIMVPQLYVNMRSQPVGEALGTIGLIAWLSLATVAPVATGACVAFARSLQYEPEQAEKREAKSRSKAVATVSKTRSDPVARAAKHAETPENGRSLADFRAKTQRQIRDCVSAYGNNPRATLPEIAPVIGVSESRASEIRRSAIECGMLEKVGPREYSTNGNVKAEVEA